MMMIKQYGSWLLYAVLAIIVVGCSGSGSCPTSNYGSPVNIGTLPNGSTMYISQSSFPIIAGGNSQTGTISISGGEPNSSFTINFASSVLQGTQHLKSTTKSVQLNMIDDNGITVTVDPTPCVIGTVGSNLPSSCKIMITTSSATKDGTYIIVPSAVDSNSGQVTQLSPITVLVSGAITPSTKAITSYSLNGVNGVITGQDIAVTMPSGTNVTALIATYITTGTSVNISGTNQVNGVTPNNFTSPVVYTVVAADGSTQDYTVTVTVASPTPAVNIALNTITPVGFVNNGTSSVGQSSTPLVLNYNANVGHVTSSTITLTYSNSGGDSSNFTTTMATLPPGWTLTTHGCNGALLSTSGTATCNDVYTFSSNAPLSALTSTSNIDHPTNFDTAAISSRWTDSGGAHTASLPAATNIGYNTNGIINAMYFLNIFVSATTHNANFATDSSIPNYQANKPIANADSICQADTNKPNDGYTYKALFAYGSDINNVAPGEKRFACGGTPSASNCGAGATAGYDWVMLPSYVQYRSLANNTLNIVGITDATYGIVTAYPQGFGNTLDHYSEAWTGLSSSSTNQWMSPESNGGGTTAPNGLTCLGWTDGTSASNRGRAGTTAGSSGSLHYYSYSSGSDTWTDKTTSVGYAGLYSTTVMYCYMTYHLYCVQQIN